MDDRFRISQPAPEPDTHRPLAAKWLRILFYIHLAALANTLISFLPIADQWTAWVSRALTVGIFACFLQLAPAHARYQKAAVFTILSLCFGLLSLFVQYSVITLAASVLSILAVYQEYSAHSDVIGPLDARLSRNWHSLFNWSIAVAVLLAIGSVIAALLVVLLEQVETGTAAVVVAILTIPDLILNIIYLTYLNRMVRLLQAQEYAQ